MIKWDRLSNSIDLPRKVISNYYFFGESAYEVYNFNVRIWIIIAVYLWHCLHECIAIQKYRHPYIWGQSNLVLQEEGNDM